MSYLIPKLQSRGFVSVVASLREPSSFASYFTEQGIPVFDLGSRLPRPLGIVSTTIRLAWLIIRYRPHFIQTYLPAANFIGVPLSALLGVGARVSSRRSLNRYQRGRRWVWALERVVFYLSHAITANARAIVKELCDEGASRAKIALIYNGFDLAAGSEPESCRTKLLSEIGASSDVFVITVVANLIGYKGHLDLLAAINRVKARLPPWRLVCAGRDDGVGDDLRQEAQRLGISDQLHMLGLRSDINALLNASDIVVLPSHEEGFPNALIEAMAVGRPVVATSVGGSVEAVEHGVTGLLVPARDPSAMSMAILDLAMNPKKRADLGRNARESLRGKYDVDLAVRQHELLYRAILAGERHFSKLDQSGPASDV